MNEVETINTRLNILVQRRIAVLDSIAKRVGEVLDLPVKPCDCGCGKYYAYKPMSSMLIYIGLTGGEYEEFEVTMLGQSMLRGKVADPDMYRLITEQFIRLWGVGRPNKQHIGSALMVREGK